jgi:DNA-directed RNA polymerase subunit RPC12/RpoP
MAVETLGEAYALGWRITARCAEGKQEGMHRFRECVYRAELDLQTLVWTRGRAFPLSRLESRLRCPRCGSRRVTILFQVPTVPSEAKADQS